MSFFGFPYPSKCQNTYFPKIEINKFRKGFNMNIIPTFSHNIYKKISCKIYLNYMKCHFEHKPKSAGNSYKIYTYTVRENWEDALQFFFVYIKFKTIFSLIFLPFLVKTMYSSSC